MLNKLVGIMEEFSFLSFMSMHAFVQSFNVWEQFDVNMYDYLDKLCNWLSTTDCANNWFEVKWSQTDFCLRNYMASWTCDMELKDWYVQRRYSRVLLFISSFPTICKNGLIWPALASQHFTITWK